MRSHIGDALAIDIDFAAVAQAFQIFGAGKWAGLVAAVIFSSHLVFLP